jgi:DNA-binding GntR family transcriptional regulator
MLKLQNIGDQVYGILLAMIINHDLEPGQRLKEEHLARQLGISRTPLRDAITRLAKDGFVELNPRKGAVVTPFEIDDVVEVYDIRKALEVLAMGLAIKNLKGKDLERIRNYLTRPTKKNLLKADTELHELIIKNCGNKRLQELLSNLYRLIEVFREAGYQSRQRSSKAQQDHLEMIKALMAKDVEKSQILMGRHIEQTKKEILDNFKPASANP